MIAINYEKDYNKDFLIKKEALEHAIYKFFFLVVVVDRRKLEFLYFMRKWFVNNYFSC